MDEFNELNLVLTPREALDRLTSDFVSVFGINLLPDSVAEGILIALSGRIAELNQQQRLILTQMFMDTATDDFLERWGAFKKITRIPASSSTGFITATGVVASIIPLSTSLTTSDGAAYQTLAASSIATNLNSVVSITRTGSTATVTTTGEHLFASGISVLIAGANETEYNGTFQITVTTATEFIYTVPGVPATPATGTIIASADMASIDVQSDAAGADTNLGSGQSLTFGTPIAGVDDTAFVQFGEVSGGTDDETDEDLRLRILDRYQNPISLFNVAGIVAQAKTVAGVTRVFVLEADPQAGFVTITFLRDQDASIIPSPQEVQDVKDRLLEIKPVFMPDSAVIVAAPIPVPVTYIIGSLVPNTPTMQEAINANIDAFFRNETATGRTVTQNESITLIQNTQNTETLERPISFVLLEPLFEPPILPNEIPTLAGVPTYP